MQKEFLIGYIGRRAVKVEIRLSDANNLAISGEVGHHTIGQIRDQLMDIDELSEGWTVGKVKKLSDIWKEWHLNDLIAGSPRQREWIKNNYGEGYAPYADICEKMPADILDDSEYLHNGKPYRYGSAWLRVDIPDDVLQWLRDL